jgi:hypothetical protein
MWEDGIKMHLRKTGCEDGDEPAVNNENFLMSIIVDFPRKKTLYHIDSWPCTYFC